MSGQIEKTSQNKEAIRAKIADAALIAVFWTGSGLSSAPDAGGYGSGQIGADSDGVAAGLTYHVVNNAWVATGGTVANLYGA